MGVHLGSIMEDDPVLIQDIHLSLGRDGAVDMGRADIPHDLVKGDPCSHIGTSSALVEVQYSL